jgi:hypothetical protein
LPEGLPVPNVSSPPDIIPSWNAHNSKDIEALFEFADGFLTDDAPLLLFLPEFKTIRDDVKAYAASYGFALAKDWWGINELPLCLPTDTKLTVHSYLNSSIFFLDMCGLYLLFDMMTIILILRIQHCI